MDNERLLPEHSNTYEKCMKTLGNVVSPLCMCVCPCFSNVMVTIAEYQFGIVLTFKRFDRILPPGVYYINIMVEEVLIKNETIIKENQTGYFTRNDQYVGIYPPGRYKVNDFMKEAITIVNDTIIDERQYGILTKNGEFVKMLPSGKHTANPITNEKITICDLVIINEGFNGLRYVDGKLVGEILRPGKYMENPFRRDKITVVDTRVITDELKPQRITSSDGVDIEIYGILVYQITDAFRAISVVKNIDNTMREIIKETHQQVLSEHPIAKILEEKQKMSEYIQNRVARSCQEFGVCIKHVGVKDIIFKDSELQASLASGAVAQSIADAKIKTADAEIEVAKRMQQVAEMMNSQAAAEMRYYDSMERIMKNGNAKILFIPPNIQEMSNAFSRIVGENSS